MNFFKICCFLSEGLHKWSDFIG